jgi:hypothetical protein
LGDFKFWNFRSLFLLISNRYNVYFQKVITQKLNFVFFNRQMRLTGFQLR